MRLNRYRFDPMALIAGTVFAGIAIAYLLRASGTLTVRPEWVLATAAIGVGLAGLAGALWAMLPARESAPAASMSRMASVTTFAPIASHPAGEAVAEPSAAEDEPGPGAQAGYEPYSVGAVGTEADVAADPVVEDERPDEDPPTLDPTK
ncbi:hypothetical protein [Embleya sp. NPDC005575]|uniref:hypothetical protein n=1 Tax=Embleya sp. NPDC005575 TaxID=3156892 RepID=UPI0033A89063